ncbi:MAG: hypothetical protein AAGI10_09590 [Pseudomonadota bacterium]
MLTFLAIAFLIALAGQAAALSCLPMDVAGSYKEAAETKETYVIALGRFDFDEAELPKRRVDNSNPPSTVVDAVFTGGLFTGEDFGFETVLEVTVEALCLGPWCGWIEPGQEVLAFIEDRNGGYHLTVSPCPGQVYTAPSAAQIEKVVACHQGKDCVSVSDDS